MINGRCPTCKTSYQIQTLKDLPTFPFCTERCRLIDLGRWIDGAFAIPGPEADQGHPEDQGVEDEDDG